ncbi:hypothetical protein Rhopal_007747-T1 [Rhodotorula paludigena]|uniref:Uncharacterized protein n=1 Tax=Rhodotorula paludigena TaxID=86838 RepID=A0AAV5GXH7_9BASI|nr:hypothetical protein Rhopal_007747-T1 [Rhodotorula paludigena]
MALTTTASPILHQQTIPATCGPSVLVNTTSNIRLSGKRVGFGWIPRYSVENGPQLVNVTYDMLQPSLPEPYWIITEGEYDLPGVYRIRFHNDIDLCLASDDDHLASAQECTDSAAAWNITCTSCEEAGVASQCEFRAMDVDQCVTYAAPDVLVFKDCLGLGGTNTTQTWDFDQAMYA